MKKIQGGDLNQNIINKNQIPYNLIIEESNVKDKDVKDKDVKESSVKESSVKESDRKVDIYKLTAKLLRDNAYNYIKSERENYKVVYDTILKYIIKHKLLVSDLFVLTDNLDDIQRLDDLHYNVYCNLALEHTNNLTNELYNELIDNPLVETLNMNTVMENEEFNIQFDTRFVVKINSLNKNKRGSNLDLTKIINPFVFNNVNYLPVEIELINLYHLIYTQGININLENILYEKWLKNNKIDKIDSIENIDIINNNISLDKIGGYDNLLNLITDNDDIIGGNDSCYERKRDELEAIKVAICKDVLSKRKDIILLGGVAIEWLQHGENICPKYDRLQVMSTMSTKELQALLNNYMKKLKRKYIINISEELDLLLPKDNRTKRVVFSVSINSKEKPILEYFTNCSFELVPAFLSNNILIANRNVLMRFLLIDIYITKFINHLGKLELSTYKNKLTRYYNLIDIVYNIKSEINGVLGSYIDPDIEKRLLLLNNQDNRHFPYNPSNYFKKNNSLRKIKN